MFVPVSVVAEIDRGCGRPATTRFPAAERGCRCYSLDSMMFLYAFILFSLSCARRATRSLPPRLQAARLAVELYGLSLPWPLPSSPALWPLPSGFSFSGFGGFPGGAGFAGGVGDTGRPGAGATRSLGAGG